MAQPQRLRSGAALAASCTEPNAAGQFSCLEPVKDGDKLSLSREVGTKTIQSLPQWCYDNAYKGQIFATRFEACEISGVRYVTYIRNSGGITITGWVDMHVLNFAYTFKDLASWGHQIELIPYDGSGDALAASVSGGMTVSGWCSVSSSSFPPQPVQPFDTRRSGEAYLATTATAVGAIGSCTTKWTITASHPNYPSAQAAYPMTDIRCDNATGGTSSIGCVVPWYPSAAVYSQEAYPELTSHVARAQASGLKGGSFASTLTRTTDQTIVDRNRDLACGDAPSIEAKSCDEYPPAQAKEGLSSGGTRRTFDNCSFNLPPGAGPDGVSVCMIKATENNAQGGIHAQFFKRERVLDGDPWRVLIGP